MNLTPRDTFRVLPPLETVSQYRSWFENLTTNGQRHTEIQSLNRSSSVSKGSE
jgi:hypothetical protein